MKAMAGDKALSEFLRDAVFGQSAKRRPPTLKTSLDRRQSAQILAVLGQDARVATFKAAASAIENGIVDVDEAIQDDVQACRDLLLDIRDRLIAAKGMKP